MFKKGDKKKPKGMSTSLQDELTALWSGNSMDFEMEGDDGLFTFIVDEDEED